MISEVDDEETQDDAAVDRFAAAMKEKLAAARAKGRGGWQDNEPGMQQRLSNMLRARVEKGDPLDVANFAMFLHQRSEAILPDSVERGVDEAMVLDAARYRWLRALVRPGRHYKRTLCPGWGFRSAQELDDVIDKLAKEPRADEHA